MAGQMLHKLRRFHREDAGTASLEFVIWVPTVAAMLVLVADLALCLFAYTHMWKVARDTTRLVSVGEIAVDEGKSYIQAKLPNYGVYQVSVTEVGTSDISVSITGNSISPFIGTLDLLSVGTMGVTHTTRMEGGVAANNTAPST